MVARNPLTLHTGPERVDIPYLVSKRPYLVSKRPYLVKRLQEPRKRSPVALILALVEVIEVMMWYKGSIHGRLSLWKANMERLEVRMSLKYIE